MCCGSPDQRLAGAAVSCCMCTEHAVSANAKFIGCEFEILAPNDVSVSEPMCLEVKHIVPQHFEFNFCLSSRCVDCNNVGISYRHAQLVYIMYFILATCFDPIWSSSRQ
jgi:hypothetical protein